MSSAEYQRIQALLKSSLPRTGNPEPARDLWPDMLHRLEVRYSRRVTFSLLDWAIAGLVAATVFVFPGVISKLFYHL